MCIDMLFILKHLGDSFVLIGMDLEASMKNQLYFWTLLTLSFCIQFAGHIGSFIMC